MGRRSRQRSTSRERSLGPPAPPAASTPASPSRASRSRSRREAAPAPPWGRFPLVELSVLAALVLGVWGLVQGGRAGLVLLAAAALLGSVAGLEVSIREHVAGYRSHTLVLSLTIAVAVMAALYFTRVARPVPVLVGIAAFALACLALRALYQRRASGLRLR
ncbi:MAG: hypothetical protein JWQ48_2608 [Conexibacter sp.]|nr:hypothetical protein [Conexibacter sp.]